MGYLPYIMFGYMSYLPYTTFGSELCGHNNSFNKHMIIYLQFHVDNAGEALPGDRLYRLHLQAIPITAVLIRLDKVTLI